MRATNRLRLTPSRGETFDEAARRRITRVSEFDLYKLPNSDERPPWISFYRITDQRTSRTEGARRELH